MEENYLVNQIGLQSKKQKLIEKKEKKKKPKKEVKAKKKKKIKKIIGIKIKIEIIIIEKNLDRKKLIFVTIVEKKDIGLMNVMNIEEKGKILIYKM